MKKGLFLDDERYPNWVSWVDYGNEEIEWTIARTHKLFVAMLNKHHFDVYSFDHDLADFHEVKKGTTLFTPYGTHIAPEDHMKEYTGFDCAIALRSFMYDNDTYPEVFVHTQNPIGRDKILNVFKERY